MDTGTGLTILGTALGGKDLIVKLLGPTADYIGSGMKDFAQKRVDNVTKIFRNASKKLQGAINEEGSVAPKVLRGILDEGSYSDDSLSIEYFGGVLASSRTGVERDDRGAYFNSLVSRLSVYQLRCHYIIYSCIKKAHDGSSSDVKVASGRDKLTVFIPFDVYRSAMDFSQAEGEVINNIISHTIAGLNKESLTTENIVVGKSDYILERFPFFKNINEPGIVVTPTLLGIELFLWAHGKGQSEMSSYLDKDFIFSIDDNIHIEGNILKKPE